MIKTCSTAALAAFALAIVVPQTRAATFDFSYTGSSSNLGYNPFNVDDTVNANGSFTVDDVNNPATIDDVTAFSMTLTAVYPDDLTNQNAGVVPETDTFTYDLNNLMNFSATLDAGTITDLTIMTNAGNSGAYVGNWDQALYVANLSTDGASTNDGEGDPLSSGMISLTAAAVPEPGTLSVLSLGVAGLLLARRRRSQAALLEG